MTKAAKKTPTKPAPEKFVNSYFVKIPKSLWDKLEAARKARLHNKTAAITVMADLYLAETKGLLNA